MKIEELRHNNLIEVLTSRRDTKIPLPTGVHGYVNEIRKNKVQIRLKNQTGTDKEILFMRELESIAPIKLTEDIVIDLGLNAVELENSEWFYQDNKFRLNKNYAGFYYSNNLDIKYVHQLQNLYFALTGCELQYVA
jgi:hypothetical protein